VADLEIELMEANRIVNYIKEVLENKPSDWLNLTTHRLDIYNEKLAKTQFVDQFENLYKNNISESSALDNLRTAYDYIRLGHPLSCILEWVVAQFNNLKADYVISFASRVTPILAILRKNLLSHKNTRIYYINDQLPFTEPELIKRVYGYNFELKRIESIDEIADFEGSTILISQQEENYHFDLSANIDFYIHVDAHYGSILLVNGDDNENYVSEIQHVRRRETIAMTPINCLAVLKGMVERTEGNAQEENVDTFKDKVLESIASITGTSIKALVGSSGLSIQYAIMMGLIHHAQENHSGKAIKFVVPPNCYGGTNDQARRVAACLEHVEVVDLPVDGGEDMEESVEMVLAKIADEDAIPYIIAEIPTNPRVEVPDLLKLKEALSKERKTREGQDAITPVFILDQTFCPNVLFLGEGKILSTVQTISYASGSKFPSGGKCTAGYCVGNDKTAALMDKIAIHLRLCDNEATDLQLEILAKQLPSMNQRINDAYENTREFVNFIAAHLPEAKMNFVSKELADDGFTPSVFSLDLPTKGDTSEEKEAYKRALNLKLIHLMISEIPNESKFCVSYGQLKGCYWTVPATSTQGTTKEGDKDYIVRAALSPKMDLELHKKVFLDFVGSI